jgi:hypothetical protein
VVDGAAPTLARAAAPGRGVNGRFTEGNKFAAGNAFHRQVAERRKALLAAVSAQDVARLARRLYRQGLRGDVASAKVLLLYLIGRPAEAADPDTLDADEISKLLQAPDVRTLLAAAADRLPSATAVGVVEAVLQAAPGRLVEMLDAARQKPAPPPPLTRERWEQLLAQAQQDHGPEYTATMKTAGGHPGTTEETCP